MKNMRNIQGRRSGRLGSVILAACSLDIWLGRRQFVLAAVDRQLSCPRGKSFQLSEKVHRAEYQNSERKTSCTSRCNLFTRTRLRWDLLTATAVIREMFPVTRGVQATIVPRPHLDDYASSTGYGRRGKNPTTLKYRLAHGTTCLRWGHLICPTQIASL